jgi:hypothetical protein
MELKPGQRLQSVVGDAEVIVVRAPAAPVEITCVGQPMIEVGGDAPYNAERGPAAADDLQLGKRYADDAIGLELLVTRAGAGPLQADGVALELRQAKPLPSSD